MIRLTFATLTLTLMLSIGAVLIGYATPNGVIAYTHVEWIPTEYDLHLLDVWRGHVYAIAAAPDRDESLPVWSADGDALFFDCGRGLALQTCCRDLSRTGACDQSILPPGGIVSEEATESPDGEWIVYVEADGRFLQLYLLNRDTGDIMQLTHEPADHRNPAWRP